MLGVVCDRSGLPKWLAFSEGDGCPQRRVRLDFVRAVGDGAVRLAGPREGYHITRVMRE